MAYPSPAQNYAEKRLNLGDLVRLSPSSSYLMRCDSDYPTAGILQGAILVVERALVPIHRSLIIAEVDQALVVRRLLKQPQLALQTLDQQQSIQWLQENTEPPVWGVIAYVLNDVAGNGFNF